MAKEFTRNVSLTGEIKFTGLRLKEPMHHSAGLLGVKEALRHTFKEMGIAKSMKTLAEMNQEDGFRCPSCAWPVPKNPSNIAEYCENGAKALADEATKDHIGADFFSKHSVEELSLLSDYELNKLGRVVEPMVLRPNSVYYEPIDWAEAYDLIAEKLHQLNTPNEAIFYTSGRSSNEAAFLYGMFARAFGTNNMPDCSNMCHESSGVALSQTLGIGKGSVTLDDLHGAEVVLVVGQNPGTNHPRMLSALEKCKKNGGKVISINPLAETGLVSFKNPQKVSGILGHGQKIADLHLPVRINEDIALAKLILKKLVTLDAQHSNVLDHEFIVEYVDGYDELIENLSKYEIEELQRRTGVSMRKIDKAVQLLAEKSNIVICWAMGITQHKNAVNCIQEYINILLLKGAIGKPFAGTCPVRGHSNVQGDRSVGIMHYVNKTLNQKIKEHLLFDPPTEQGYDTVEAIQAMHEKKAKVFICLGGNFVMAASDTQYTAEAIENCILTVQISTKLNRSHLVTGKTALLLPTYGRSEKDEKNGELQFMTMESSMGKVRQSKGLLPPASEHIKSEPEIISQMAHAYFKGEHPMDWNALGQDYNLIRNLIDKTVKGFENTSEQSKGFGYYLPNNVRERDFRMLPNGMAQLTINPLSEHQLKPDELLLMTIRSHDQFNTTIYGLNDRYRGIYNERRVVFMHEDDMKDRNLNRLDVVNLHSFYDDIQRTAEQFLVIPYDIPKGNMAAYFPETNLLVPHNQFADKSQTPISKSIKVTVEKVS
ncbi:FdhF/YdeP family oxidoreductase [Flagellimonas zhangzhouensis]|uniref:Oxidoreductase alpha (Molybdopterin) subunit n=1 Tax=Flagellimonas zhangzhouensis TaxID=1073328 RepID=A0A1H2WN67_9FLAO|nr:FdhF/YdeP family oxidoreductase [Allomuricauda zhangzhouensis]SDQ22888.1 oxidoreductase alpha (molybdopterin) subunit [Allomuricauda zhangzhouensis]SDW81926.1 oxidoreductase alpha (molybdopterin) subunit [Allomuricauda zhangzhouensis]